MSRQELFSQAYPDGVDQSPLFDQEYTHLKNLWDAIPEEDREELFDLPPVPEAKGLDGRKAANVAEVAQQYRYRLASEFCSDLPPIFRHVMMLADDIYATDLLFFGTLAALSAALPGVRGSLMRETVSPNLYIFISGHAAAGKGKVNLCRRLLEPLAATYQSEYILPANSTDTVFYEELAANGGRGIVFESEADTLSDAFCKPSGKFSEGLRKAFHNETISYMRRTGDERIVIDDPVLSILLTGTPGQVGRLFKSPENGLFSRFLFYRLNNHTESYVEDSTLHGNITGDKVRDYLHVLGCQVRDFYMKLTKKETGVMFRLTEQQNEVFLKHFHDATIEYRELFRQGYGSDEAADHAESIMRRLGNICYKMMMILSVSRLIGEEGEIPDEVECHEDDFEKVMDMEPTLRYHNNVHYDEMMVAAKVVEPLTDENANTGDMLTELQRAFYNALPDTFIKQEALKVAEEMMVKMSFLSLTPRAVTRYLERFCDLGILIRVKRGCYRKNDGSNKSEAQLP